MDGKSWGLLGVLRDHRGAVEYDFRTRFGCGLNIIGGDMSLAEAARHVARFADDPSSALAAEKAGWHYPVSREALAVMDLFDAFAQANFKKPTPYPRPFERPRPTAQRGNAGDRTPEQVKALLREQFGQPEAPV